MNLINRKLSKAFTLIELLAVIVIIAVIALITIPIVVNVIENSQKNAFIDSAYGIIEAGRLYYMENINGKEEVKRYDFSISNNKFVLESDNTKELKFTGKMPKTGMLQIHGNGKESIGICNDTYCACKSISEIKVTIKEGNCNIDSETGEILKEQNIDGNPAGTVISYMGANIPPEGYLACDGKIYNISDYPKLAETFKKGLGSYNYYGGDGVVTFAVPNLKGEFLRGTGTNDHTNQGSGEEVGTHQDGTEIPRMGNYHNHTLFIEAKMATNSTTWDTDEKADSRIPTGTTRPYKDIGYQTDSNSSGYRGVMTTRPTNTSVLYAIKY